MAAAQRVRVPIRYGRRSIKTGTYTMVFAPGCPAGIAKVVPCVTQVGLFDQLLDEARALWLAESPDGSPRKSNETLSANWGCVALLANPQSEGLGKIVSKWADCTTLQHEPGGKRFYDRREFEWEKYSAITDEGVLTIPWPTDADTEQPLQGFDLLLATATRPKNEDTSRIFPDASLIANGWKKTRNDEYFRENRKNGFCTFQDEAIESELG